MKKAIDTNSLWENLVQLTDNLDDYSIFHQVINRNSKGNTMDILFVASKLADINNYTNIIKNSGLNPVIIDVKCFALKSGNKVLLLSRVRYCCSVLFLVSNYSLKIEMSF